MYQDMNFLYNREEQEYNEFMAKFSIKIAEINRDFDHLSPENQQRVLHTLREQMKNTAALKLFLHLMS